MVLQAQNLDILWFLVFLSCIFLSDAAFEGCDHSYPLQPDSTVYLRSPLWPGDYPSRTSCRYRFEAPVGYEINFVCDIDLDQGSNGCSTELFYTALDGDTQMRTAQQYCGTGQITRTSQYRKLVLAYISDRSSTATGKFECKLTTRSQPCDCGWYKVSRIVGGRQTHIEEFSSMAALLNEGHLFCSGTIVSSRFVLTAAHCAVLQPSEKAIAVVTGVNDLSNLTSSPYAALYQVEKIHVHENYDTENVLNDIAILRTVTIIEYSKSVGPACIPFSRPNDDFTYEKVYVAGYGTISFGGPVSYSLRSTSLQVITKDTCEKTYSVVYPTQICTFWYGKDSCQMDSGGAVYLQGKRNYIIGIISYGKECSKSPGLNTRITSYISWIYNFVKSEACYFPM